MTDLTLPMPPIHLRLPGFDHEPHHLATDGSWCDDASDHIGTYATIAGSFICSTPATSHFAELQAVRFGLRELVEPYASARLFTDHRTVGELVQRMSQRARVPHTTSEMRELEALADIRRIAAGLNLTVSIRPNGDDLRAPKHPLMLAAHRLSWATCKLVVDGIEFDQHTRAWLTDFGALPGRRKSAHLKRYRRFRQRRHAAPAESLEAEADELCLQMIRAQEESRQPDHAAEVINRHGFDRLVDYLTGRIDHELDLVAHCRGSSASIFLEEFLDDFFDRGAKVWNV